MQNFDPQKQHDRLAMLEKVVFGHDVPDYVRQPSAEETHPPIRQVQDKNPDGSGKVDRYNAPVMVDAIVHKPGLLDAFTALHSKVSGTEPAAVEGGAVNAMALLASMAGDVGGEVVETAKPPRKRK